MHEEPVPPGRLRASLSRDLESVCLKCLEKKPERRYASATVLAEDLRRFLNGQATQARPLSAWQRTWRGLLRRPRLALAVTVGLLALVAVAGVWWYVAGVQDSAAALSADVNMARQERDRVEAEATAARQRSYARQTALLAESAKEGRLTVDKLTATGPEELRGFEWHFLRRLADTGPAGTEWFVGRGHMNSVSKVAFSPDGQLCASASLDHTIIVWDMATQQQRWRLIGHRLCVTAVALSPDGKTLASAASESDLASAELKLWDVETGRGQPLNLTLPKKGMIDDVAFAPDGKTLAICGTSDDSTAPKILLWDLRFARWRVLPSLPLEKPNYHTPALAFSRDGKLVAVGFGTRADTVPQRAGVQLFDVATGARTATLTGHLALVDAVAFTPDSTSLLSGDLGQTVKIWDLSTRQQRGSLQAGFHPTLSPDGTRLAAAEDGRVLQLWDVATGRRIARIGSVPSAVYSLRFAPGGTSVAVGCRDATVRLFHTGNIHDLPGHRPAEAWAVAFAPEGKTLATAGDDHTIRLWNLPDFKQRRVLRGHANLVISVAFSPDGRTLASGGFDHTVRLWDAATGHPKAVLRGHAQPVRVVAFSPDGRLLATAAKSVKQGVGEVKLWDLAAGKQRTTLTGDGTSVAFSPDGRLLAFRAVNGDVKFLDLSTLSSTHSISHPGSVTCVTFAPDGKTLATADTEGVVKLWDVKTGAEKSGLRSHGGKEVRALVFCPDGKTLATAGMDRTVVLRQAATGLELLRFKDLPDYARGLTFSPDSATLAVACHDGTVRLYQGKRGR
jgi:WD40 repeat protein